MSASHDSSGSSSNGTAVPTTTTTNPNGANLAQINPMGSSDQGWLSELQTLGYSPNSGVWAPTPQPQNGTAVGVSNLGGLNPSGPVGLTGGTNSGLLSRIILGK